MSFSEPHPPIVPPEQYIEMYRDREIDMPFVGEWAKEWDSLPSGIKARRWSGRNPYSDDAVRIARQGFYAMCTHLDHQLRLVIGMLREERLLDNTAVMFTSDHGEMLGNHGQWAKDLFYEESAKIPMVLMPPASHSEIGKNLRDDRLVVQADIFPTLADICGVPVPDTIEGLSMVGDRKRDYIYGEHWENETASRMIRDEQYKLIYYPLGNHFQLFDLDADPDELHDPRGRSFAGRSARRAHRPSHREPLRQRPRISQGRGTGGRARRRLPDPRLRPELRRTARMAIRNERQGDVLT